MQNVDRASLLRLFIFDHIFYLLSLLLMYFWKIYFWKRNSSDISKLDFSTPNLNQPSKISSDDEVKPIPSTKSKFYCNQVT